MPDSFGTACLAAAVLLSFFVAHVELVFVGAATLSALVLGFRGGDFHEVAFVFVLMLVASTRPVLRAASHAVRIVSRGNDRAFLFTALALGPLLGSLITEPAAMTVSALLLQGYFERARAKYLALATLFVNVSIGGVLTSFAAPPVLMVARPWGWDTRFMFIHFGWKALVAVVINAAIVCALPTPGGIATVPSFGKPKWAESAMVALFLASLVVLGEYQTWWLQPLLARLEGGGLFLGSAALTSIIDNAAITYFGTLVPALAPELRYALVAGAVGGGGLTVIANAPNPAGMAILRPAFGRVRAHRLAGAALLPTAIALACFWFL